MRFLPRAHRALVHSALHHSPAHGSLVSLASLLTPCGLLRPCPHPHPRSFLNSTLCILFSSTCHILPRMMGPVQFPRASPIVHNGHRLLRTYSVCHMSVFTWMIWKQQCSDRRLLQSRGTEHPPRRWHRVGRGPCGPGSDSGSAGLEEVWGRLLGVSRQCLFAVC